MTALRDRLPVVPRGQYEAVLRERDDWERRARDAAQRTSDARRWILPPAARRSVLAVAIAGMWLVIVGVFLGGAAIPHHDDRPVLATPSDVSPGSFRTLSSVGAVCTAEMDSARAARARAELATPCPRARATPASSRMQPRRRPQPD